MLLKAEELESLVRVSCGSPHSLLGMHPLGDGSGVVGRALRVLDLEFVPTVPVRQCLAKLCLYILGTVAQAAPAARRVRVSVGGAPAHDDRCDHPTAAQQAAEWRAALLHARPGGGGPPCCVQWSVPCHTTVVGDALRAACPVEVCRLVVEAHA